MREAVLVRGKGIAINEPSVVAMNPKTRRVLAVGAEAKQMVGRTPANIVAVRPLRDGVISDFDVTEQMLRYFIEKVHEQYAIIPRPRVVIGISSGVTEVERRAVHDATINAGAREVFLIEEPMAAAIGAGLPVQDAAGSMIVDIGGGTTEVAVISLGGIVGSRWIRIAGDEMDQDIITHMRQRYNLLIGERMAEEAKIASGSGEPVKVRGRDLKTGLPAEVEVTPEEVHEAIAGSVNAILDAVTDTIEETPPELVADLMVRGITLAGGGALLQGMDQRLREECQMPAQLTESPLTCVAVGSGRSLEEFEVIHRMSRNSHRRRIATPA